MILEKLGTAGRAVGDALSLTALFGTITQVLPPIAALISIIYGLLLIWEMQTVKAIRRARRIRRQRAGK